MTRGRREPRTETTVKVKTITEAEANLSKLVAEVERGAVVVIGRAGKPVAKLVPFASSSEPRDLGTGTWAGRVRIGHDFDELPAEFLSHFEPESGAR